MRQKFAKHYIQFDNNVSRSGIKLESRKISIVAVNVEKFKALLLNPRG